MSVLLALLCLHFFWTVSASASDDHASCPSLVTVGSSRRAMHCVPWGNCTGLNCHDPILNMNLSFTVNQCTDPLVVNVSVINTTTGETVDHQSITKSCVGVCNGDYDYNLHLRRNESHVNVTLTASHHGDTKVLSIPQTEVFLNTSYCMCQSMEHIRDKMESPVATSCVTDDLCTGLECDLLVEADNSTYFVDTEVYPCTKPPGFLFIVEDPDADEMVFEEFFNQSRNVTLLGRPFNVEVQQLNYSFIIHGVLDEYGHPFEVIPETQVILDKSHCIEPPSVPVPTDTTPSSHVSKETCDSMKQLASQAPPELGKCITNEACDTIICTTFNEYKSEFKLLPCDNPPSVGTTIIDPEGEVIYHQIVSNSSEIPLGPFGTTLYLTVSSKPGVMSIEVELGIPLVGRTAFIPRTDIPIDECQCVDVSYSLSCLTTPTPLSSSHQRPASSKGASVGSDVVLISVPIAVFCFILIVVIVVVVIVIRVRKRSNGYTFHPVSLDNIKDEDDEVLL